jgi:hypothetical protein
VTRVICPVCGRDISLTAAGNFRYHNYYENPQDGAERGHCKASWGTPERAAEIAAKAWSL